MYDFEDYYYPSEDEILIDETVEKLKRSILERAKHDIESQTKEVEQERKLKEQYHKWYEIELTKLKDKEKENKDLKKKIENLEMKLNSKLHSIPNHKYNVGDEIYTVGGSWGYYVTCPTCNGKGTIKATTEEYGEIEAICPDCGTNKKYKTKVEYRNLYPVKAKVCTVNIYLSAKDGLQICYGTGSMPIDEDKIFETFEECKEYCDKTTEETKQVALKELGVDKELEKL